MNNNNLQMNNDDDDYYRLKWSFPLVDIDCSTDDPMSKFRLSCHFVNLSKRKRFPNYEKSENIRKRTTTHFWSRDANTLMAAGVYRALPA